MTTATAWPVAGVPAQERLGSAFWGVMLGFLLHGLVVSTWVSRIASIKSALRLGDGVFGLALLGSAIGSMAAIPVCGALVVRKGSRAMALWTSAGFCLTLAPLALAWNGWTLFLALLLYGALAGANDVALNAQAVGTEKRLGTPSMSRFHAMFSAGGIAGAAAGGLMAASRVSPLLHLASAGAAILGLVYAMSRLLIEMRPEQSRRRARVRAIPMSLLVLSLIGFCIFLSEGAIADWTGVYLKQVLGAGDGFAAAGYMVFSIAMAIFRLAGDAIVVRIGRLSLIRLGGYVAAAGLFLAVVAHSPWWALLGFAAAGAGFSSIIPSVFASGGRVNGTSEGAGVATVSGIGYLGFLFGPPAIGLISEMTSLRGGLFLLVVLSACAAWLVRGVARGGCVIEAGRLRGEPIQGTGVHF